MAVATTVASLVTWRALVLTLSALDRWVAVLPWVVAGSLAGSQDAVGLLAVLVLLLATSAVALTTSPVTVKRRP